MKKVLSIFLAGLWINLSEFLRNEVLLKSHWQEHFAGLNLSFPSNPINGIVWVIWGFLLATAIYSFSQKMSTAQTFLWSWTMGFLMMWLVVGNLLVLPFSILIYAIPLSLLEIGLALWIIRKLAQNSAKNVD
jgi:hypothetical protein